MYDSNTNIWIRKADAQGSLYTDANSGSPSISGAAYKVLLDAANRSRPDFANDPMLNMSKDTYNNIDLISQGFGDCSAESVIKTRHSKLMCQNMNVVKGSWTRVLTVRSFMTMMRQLLSTMTDRTTSKVVGLIARNYGLVR